MRRRTLIFNVQGNQKRTAAAALASLPRQVVSIEVFPMLPTPVSIEIAKAFGSVPVVHGADS